MRLMKKVHVDFTESINTQNLEYDFVRNYRENEEMDNRQTPEHVRVNDARNDGLSDLSMDSEYLPKNQDSDWKLATENEE